MENLEKQSKNQFERQIIMNQHNNHITNNVNGNDNKVGNDNTINQKNISQKEISSDEFRNLFDEFIQDLHKIVVQDNLDDDDKEDLKNQIKKLETQPSPTKTKSALEIIKTIFTGSFGSFLGNEASKHIGKLDTLLKSLPSIIPQ